MATAARKDPYLGYNFKVSIDSIQVAGFRACSGLDASLDVVEYREGTMEPTARKLSGLDKYSNITLARGVSDDHALFDWIKDVLAGKNRNEAERKSMSIMLMNEKGDTVKTWNFKECWPSSFKAGDMDATKSEVAIETLVIEHEGMLLK